MQAGETDNVEQTSKSKSVELFNLKKTTEGITETIKDFVPDIEAGIAQVDNSMQSVINQMGQGQGIAQGIKEEYSQAAIEVIKLGGTQEKALEIQTKTLDVLGRNVVLSAEQTKSLFAAQQVSGVQIDVLEKAFINAGKSIKDISKEMLQVREVANNMGVNAKAVSALVVQNLDKLNRYGFQNGVEGLAKMAASSQALGIDMNETLDLADDLMSPERSMEVAAMFQRMGASSAALTNPLKLMDLSMNDTAKLQEELGDYFKSFAKFNEKTGQFEIAKSERLKIKQLSQELGISREQVEKMALAGADLDRKLSKISFAGFNVDEETQQMVANMAVMGEGGEYAVKTKQIKDGKEQLVETSIQQLLRDAKGDKDKIKELLGAEKTAGVEGKTPEEINAEMARLADGQLSKLTRIDKGIEALEKSPGLTAGASKLGEDLLKANEVLAKAINESFGEQFATKTKEGEDTEYKKSLDEFGAKLEKALKESKEPGADLKSISKDLLGAGVDFSKNLGNVVAKGGAKALGELGDVTGAEQILKDAGLEEKLQKGIDEIKEQIKTKEDELEFNIPDKVFNINEQNVGKLNIDGEFNIGKTLDINQIDAKNVVLGEGAESIVSGQVEEIKKIGDGVTETNKQLIEAQGKLSTDIKEQSEPVETQEIKVITEPTVTQPEIIVPATQPVETEGEFNINEGKPTGFVPQVGPALADLGSSLGLDLNEFVPLEQIIPTPTPTPIPTAENTQVEKIEGELSSIEQLKVGSSEIQTLNVENLNIGTALNDVVAALNSIPEKQEQVNVLVDEIIEQQKNVEQVTAQPETQNIEPTKAIVELPEVTEELPELAELPKGKTKGGFLEKILTKEQKIEPEKEPSAYENYKKLLEEINNAEVVGQGEEAFFLTTEMIAQAKKDSEFIGPEKQEPRITSIPTTEKPNLKKEIEGIQPEMSIEDKEEYYYNKSKEFKKEAKELQSKGPLGKEDEDILKSIESRAKKYSEYSDTLYYDEIDPLAKIESKGLIEDKGLAPIKPTLASLPIPEKEEKQPLGKRLKEGIGEIKEKLKGKKEEEMPIAAVPETQEEYIIRDKEGKELARSIDRETAEKKAGTSEGITVSKETRAITPSAPEIPVVGVEKAAAVAEEKTPFKERLKEGIGNLAEKGKEGLKKLLQEKTGTEGKITIEEPKETKGVETEPKVESGYLKMLEENDEKAIPFLTSKSGKPVNLDKTEADKIDVKAIEESVPKEKDTRSVLEKISLTADEDEGIIEPVEPTGIKPVEPEETEIQKTLRENREKQLSYLEELRLKEQVPETPSRGIEKFASKIGGIGEKLFGPQPTEIAPTLLEAIEEIPTGEYVTTEEPTEFQEIMPIEAIGETATAIPEPTQPSFGQIEDLSGQRSFGEPQAQQGESTQNINIKATIEIVGNSEFAKLLDPRKFQETIEGVMTKSIGNPQFAQKISTGTQRANMGMVDK